jgi:murein DD-endopeptidase MepM/ murein hydrolase activator NlpD
MRPRMVLTRRFWVGVSTTALACALFVGTAAGERTRSRRARSTPVKLAPAAPAEVDGPLGARLHAVWVFYQALADWQLRSELTPSSYAVARRALSVALGMATASPGAAVAAALTPEPSVLEQRPVMGGVSSGMGGVSSGYGVRRDPFKRRRHKKHNGVDLRAERGVPVLAAGPGMVAKAERMRGYGRVVYLDHGGGVETRYAHLQRIRVREGQFVAPGALVGNVGSSGRSTGPHLHFEVRENGRPVAPVEIFGLLSAHPPLAARQGPRQGHPPQDAAQPPTQFVEAPVKAIDGRVDVVIDVDVYEAQLSSSRFPSRQR